MAKTFILSTVGTSLINSLRKELEKGLTEVPNMNKSLELIKKTDPHLPVCGAEINSLTSLIKDNGLKRGRIEHPIKMMFLISDTEDGGWTGEFLKKYFSISKDWEEVEEADYIVVSGLTPKDPKKFASEGLRNLVKLASKQLKNHHDTFKLINATGGFKAQISFAGLIGQILSVPVIYMFETFPYCIEMPPMPVDFNYDLWLEHYDLFKLLSDEGLVASDEIDLRDADKRFLGLLDSEEVDGKGFYALSPILELMHQGFCSRPFTEFEREPKASEIDAKDRIKLPTDEHHYPKGFKIVLDDIARLRWVNRITSFEFRNSRRKSLLHRNPDHLDEIRFQWADDEKACVFIVYTTIKNDGELRYCHRILNDIIQR